MRNSWWVLGVVGLVICGGSLGLAVYAGDKADTVPKVVLGEKEAPQIIMTAVKTDKGILLGWRGEVINMSQDKDLVLVMRGERGTNCLFDMTTAQGQFVAAGYPEAQMVKACPPGVRDFRLVRVVPGAGHTWFAPAPDLHITVESEGKQVDLPKGRYKIAVKFMASYFVSHAGDEVVPQYPPYGVLRAKSETMEVEIDPVVRKKEDLMGTYLRQRGARMGVDDKG